MSILITGGTGWVGTGLAHRLVERGEDLILFDIAPQRRDWYQRECVFSGSKGDWLYPGENIYPACPAQYCGARPHHFHHQHRRGDYL